MSGRHLGPGVEPLTLPCARCGKAPRYISSNNVQYSLCETHYRADAKKYSENYERSQAAKAAQALVVAKPEVPTKRRAVPVEVPEDTPLGVEGTDSWLTLINMVIFADSKANRLVKLGAANEIRVSADVSDGVSYSLTVGRTGRSEN